MYLQVRFFSVHHFMGLEARKPVFGGFGNNKGADRPGQMHNLISAFVIRLLESIISRLAKSENFNFLASLCSKGEWFESSLSETPKTGFVASRPI